MGNELQIIKCVTDNSQLVTKSTIENFTTNSQLIVNESQEAIFYKDGQALDLFGSGRHTLTTENLPFFKRFFSKLFGRGDKSPFTCEVFFINKVSVLDIIWGTDTPIQLEDPKYGLLVNVRANGQTGLKVTDSRKFVVKIVGQLPQYTIETIRKAIKGIMLSIIKESIATAIINHKISVLEITTHLSELASDIQTKVNDRLLEYGIELAQFNINTIFAGDNDLQKLREVKEKRLVEINNIELEALRTEKLDIDMEAKRMQAWGYSYQDRRQFDVLESAAQNTGGATGGIIGAGVGLGVGFGVMNQMSSTMQNMTAQAAQNTQPVQQAPQSASVTCAFCNASLPAGSKFCSSCGKELPTKKFCTNCGQELAPDAKFCSSCGNKL